MPVARQRVRLARPHGRRARREPPRRAGRARREAARPEAARHVRRAPAQARHAHRSSSAGPRRVSGGALPGDRRDGAPSLAGLPVLQCWPGDGGRYITLPGVFTRDPRTGPRNVGMYRLQVFDDRTLGMHWQTHKGGAEHHRVADEHAASPTAHAGGHRARRRSRDDLRGVGAAAARRRRGRLRRLASRPRRRDGALPHDRPRGARPGRDRAGGLRRPARAAARGAVRRSHGLLLAGARLSGLPSHGGHAARAADLSDDDRGPPAAGGLLARQGDRAALPADHPADAARRSST